MIHTPNSRQITALRALYSHNPSSQHYNKINTYLFKKTTKIIIKLWISVSQFLSNRQSAAPISNLISRRLWADSQNSVVLHRLREFKKLMDKLSWRKILKSSTLILDGLRAVYLSLWGSLALLSSQLGFKRGQAWSGLVIEAIINDLKMLAPLFKLRKLNHPPVSIKIIGNTSLKTRIEIKSLGKHRQEPWNWWTFL